MSAAWGTGLLRLKTSASAVWWRKAICLLHVCVAYVCAGPYRASTEPVSQRCLVAVLWWGGFSRRGTRRKDQAFLCGELLG